MDAARVRVATCHDRAQAIAIREELDAHGIDAVVSGESHAPPGLEGLASGFQSFDVWVSEGDGERAAAVLGDHDATEDPTEDEEETDDDHNHDHDHDHDHDYDHGRDSLTAVEAVRSLERRKRTGMALLLSFTITFGTGHLYTRAWMRGIALAAIEIVGFGQLALNPPLAAALIAGAIVGDAVGSTLRVRAATAATGLVARLPAARVVR